MRPNWHEFAQLLRFAEDHDLDVGMNEVLFPVELSLFQLPPDELRPIVTTMEHDPTAATLTRHRHIWDGQLGALQHRLHTLDNGTFTIISPWTQRTTDTPDNWHELAVGVLTEWVGAEPPSRLTFGSADPGELRLEIPTGSDPSVSKRPQNPGESALLAIESHFGGASERSRPTSDLLNDVVLRDPTLSSAVQFRATWRVANDVTTMYLAVRNPPPAPVLPEHHRKVMEDWCGADRTVRLTCDDDERILAVEGDRTLLLPGGAADLCGSTTAEVRGTPRGGLGWARGDSPGRAGFIADSSHFTFPAAAAACTCE